MSSNPETDEVSTQLPASINQRVTVTTLETETETRNCRDSSYVVKLLKTNSCIWASISHTGQRPAYLVDIVLPAPRCQTTSVLRSTDSTNYLTPRLYTKFGERAFLHTGPAAWNSLPALILCINTLQQFPNIYILVNEIHGYS